MTNPLLQNTDAATSLALFDQIKPEHVAPAINALLADAQKALDTVMTHVISQLSLIMCIKRDTRHITAVIDNVYAERHTSYHSRH